MKVSRFANVKILIVDDSRHMRMLLRAVLQAIGLQRIYEASDGDSGFAKVLDCKPNIIVTDLSMERMDGIEFARKIRLSPNTPDPCVPIIMVTGHTEQARIEAARDAGVTYFLAKPITANGLLQRIAKILDHPKPFVRCDGYFGPDRRRSTAESHGGPRRRWNDHDAVEIA